MNTPRNNEGSALRLVLLSWVMALFPVVGLSAELVGRVTDPAGEPLENAVATDLGSGRFAISDAEGHFVLSGVTPPAEVEITCAGFRSQVLSWSGSTAEAVKVVLETEVGLFEQIFVSGEMVADALVPESIAATTIRPLAVAAAPRVIGDALAEVPGVAENGQGGIFRTYSIRGVSRSRVTTLVAGARIVSERRAGVSASFLDPVLVGSVESLRGPSSTYYGSGAIGGVVQLFPRRTTGIRARLGFSTDGDEHEQSIGFGRSRGSIDLAHRGASNSQTPDDRELHTGFQQGALIAAISGGSDQRSWSAQTVITRGDDIRKSNTDFPRRVTVYPREDHRIVRGYFETSPTQAFELYLHDNHLATDVDREDRTSNSLSDATDFGGRWRGGAQYSERWSVDYGAEYFGRRNVRASERRTEFLDDGSRAVDEVTLDDGEEDELGIYGALDRRSENGTFHLGVRWVGQRQGTAVAADEEDTAWVGSVGLTRALTPSLTLTSNLGFGTRFGSLTERFFNGTTARGVSVGNPDLRPEESAQIDVGLRWYGERAFVTTSAFFHRIDDYIERVETNSDIQTTTNLLSGEIWGVDGEFAYRFNTAWSISVGGHWLESDSDTGAPLADVPSNRVRIGGEGRFGRWGVRGRWQHRFPQTEVGPGESPLSASDIVSLAADVSLRDNLTLALSVDNATDESYFPSADDKSDLASERSAAVTLSWRRP